MSDKWIVGRSPWLELAADDWARSDPAARITLLPVSLDRSHQFDREFLRNIDPAAQTAFVAWGPEYLNFQRLELFGELKKRGVKLPPLVHPGALVSPTAALQENVWVGAMAIVGPQARVGMNATIAPGARLGAGCVVERSAWVGQDARLGDGATVGAHAYLGGGVSVAAGVRVGRQSRIETAEHIAVDWKEKSFRIGPSKLSGEIIQS